MVEEVHGGGGRGEGGGGRGEGGGREGGGREGGGREGGGGRGEGGGGRGEGRGREEGGGGRGEGEGERIETHVQKYLGNLQSCITHTYLIPLCHLPTSQHSHIHLGSVQYKFCHQLQNGGGHSLVVVPEVESL